MERKSNLLKMTDEILQQANDLVAMAEDFSRTVNDPLQMHIHMENLKEETESWSEEKKQEPNYNDN